MQLRGAGCGVQGAVRVVFVDPVGCSYTSPGGGKNRHLRRIWSDGGCSLIRHATKTYLRLGLKMMKLMMDFKHNGSDCPLYFVTARNGR